MSPPDESSSDDVRDTGPEGSGVVSWLRWFRHTDNGTVVFVREMLESAAVVAAIGLVLFAISGVWPPMVAVESGSMEPQMERGDLIFIMDESRFVPDAAQEGTGIVTYQQGQQSGYNSFNQAGDVIIYRPDGSAYRTPIIHRARFWVDEGENWYDKGNPQYMGGADSCQELPNCPAPYAGFITKGDANDAYDQVSAISDPVKPSWIRGTAEVKIPWLGHVRLFFASTGVPVDVQYQSQQPAQVSPNGTQYAPPA
ncbi:signal peptidase, endoplasmic reticulum-type [Haladaptatus litoreus]|uniref:Signal peptidase, endoplasmic reticulum-type n=1 Tax=Haladaptatus litoreus TaxID=553468 RepID=A0A1N7BZ84_9EURY|nr:S26 family signal peptidase [Haladaptatus litoreus]SIR56659.1 signal peptidase, endoplasmic reticulum-type [Haladaptatus litoreus]